MKWRDLKDEKRLGDVVLVGVSGTTEIALAFWSDHSKEYRERFRGDPLPFTPDVFCTVNYARAVGDEQ